jgi:hypothetical protein
MNISPLLGVAQNPTVDACVFSKVFVIFIRSLLHLGELVFELLEFF